MGARETRPRSRHCPRRSGGTVPEAPQADRQSGRPGAVGLSVPELCPRGSQARRAVIAPSPQNHAFVQSRAPRGGACVLTQKRGFCAALSAPRARFGYLPAFHRGHFRAPTHERPAVSGSPGCTVRAAVRLTLPPLGARLRGTSAPAPKPALPCCQSTTDRAAGQGFGRKRPACGALDRRPDRCEAGQTRASAGGCAASRCDPNKKRAAALTRCGSFCCSCPHKCANFRTFVSKFNQICGVFRGQNVPGSGDKMSPV